MMIIEPPTIPPLKTAQRLYLCKGSPWREALKGFKAGSDMGQAWLVERTYRKGDLILTILETDPPAILCLETALTDGALGADISVGSADAIDFRNGISIGAIRRRVGFTPKSLGYYEGAEAALILNALQEELWSPSPWFAAS